MQDPRFAASLRAASQFAVAVHHVTGNGILKALVLPPGDGR